LARCRLDRLDHVAHAEADAGAVANQRETTLGTRPIRVTRNRQQRTAEPSRRGGGRQRAASLGGLDDHGGRREGRDQAVAAQERPGPRPHLGVVLAHQRATRGDAGGEIFVAARRDHIEPGGQHRRRHARGLECAFVRGRVDPARQAAHDRPAEPREIGRQHARALPAVRGRRARADDRDGTERVGQRAANVEGVGRIGQIEKRGRIARPPASPRLARHNVMHARRPRLVECSGTGVGTVT
jgi:hypothetical protein